jgi:hypothetical protein
MAERQLARHDFVQLGLRVQGLDGARLPSEEPLLLAERSLQARLQEGGRLPGALAKQRSSSLSASTTGVTPCIR